jgi:hypothetical protein
MLAGAVGTPRASLTCMTRGAPRAPSASIATAEIV